MFSPDARWALYLISQFIGVLALLLMMRHIFLKAGIPQKHAIIIAVLHVISIFILSKWLFDIKIGRPFSLMMIVNPAHYFEAGFWGFLLTFIPMAALYPFVFRLSRLVVYRAIALSLPIDLFFQKLGCFFAGCCTGVECDLPWAVSFPVSLKSEEYGPPVHPVPIYDSMLMIVVFFIIRALDKKEKLRPYLFLIFLSLYSLSRFLTEMLRPISKYHLAASQKVELATIVAAIILMTVGKKLWLRIIGPPALENSK
jgi:prolipoprotein diacylglyceryltransferase